ncbi:uncharacterized protein LOC109859149 isoform X1 [Pseudomyrmex gracilis]|uniref:uncharacterized protein LOC109859149 isoform X1 n=1 Tax=Pseudomyrmex gracilis TaxID=219809 RepID=UPI000995B8CB|nr:uncharacterized protein LOC109859149 isoform X1 [Pseudomyrmex gracilis]
MMSETMMQDERTNIHYSVSSSAYYGFVPLTVRDNQQDSCNLPWRDCRLEALEEWNWQSNSRELGGGSRGQQLPREDFGRKCLKRTRDLASQERPLGLKRLRRGENGMAMPTILTLQEVQNSSMDWTCNSSAEALDVDLDAAVCTEQQPASSESCLQTWAAGNSSSISKPDHKYLSPSNDSKSDDNSSDEYEKLLFTTHGCSAYHHQRVVLNYMEI